MRILVIGDTHLPYEHKDYLSFCKRIYKDLKCSEVVHIGDLVDNHSISYHEKDPNSRGPKDEMDETDKHLKAWFKAFPKVKLCLGNHDRLPDRKGKTAGLPERCFTSFRNMWDLPDKWEVELSYMVNNVLYTHGQYYGKQYYLKHALESRLNTVVGHCHSEAGVGYVANERDLIFGMGVGTGIDRRTLAFAYQRGFVKKPIVSCGVVSYSKLGVTPTVYPMHME